MLYSILIFSSIISVLAYLLVLSVQTTGLTGPLRHVIEKKIMEVKFFVVRCVLASVVLYLTAFETNSMLLLFLATIATLYYIRKHSNQDTATLVLLCTTIALMLTKSSETSIITKFLSIEIFATAITTYIVMLTYRENQHPLTLIRSFIPYLIFNFLTYIMLIAVLLCIFEGGMLLELQTFKTPNTEIYGPRGVEIIFLIYFVLKIGAAPTVLNKTGVYALFNIREIYTMLLPQLYILPTLLLQDTISCYPEYATPLVILYFAATIVNVFYLFSSKSNKEIMLLSTPLFFLAIITLVTLQ